MPRYIYQYRTSVPDMTEAGTFRPAGTPVGDIVAVESDYIGKKAINHYLSSEEGAVGLGPYDPYVEIKEDYDTPADRTIDAQEFLANYLQSLMQWM